MWLGTLVTIPVLIPVGIYFYHYWKRMIVFFRGREKRAEKLAALFLAVALSVWAMNMWTLGFAVVMHLAGFAILMELVWRIGRRAIKKRENGAARWNQVYRSGLVPVLLTAAIFGYGYWNMHHIVATEYAITTSKQIREEGYRIALISDLHFGLTFDANSLKKTAGEVSEKQPDIVVLAGDIVDESTSYEEMRAMAKILGGIDSTYGVFYVFGNHDKNMYTRNAAYSAEQLKTELENNDIFVLVDEQFAINGELLLIGRDDRGNPQEGSRKSGDELIAAADKDCYLVLLDHQPSDISKNAALGFDLQLSGHTHGGQMWPVGLFTNLMTRLLSMDYCNYGQRQIGDYHIIVSSGIAGWGYPFKTGAKAEYVIIDIKN